MEKKYFVDIFWFKCVACNRSNHQKAYYRLFAKAQVDEARRKGVLKYTCHHCKRTFDSNQVPANSDLFEVSEREALAKGLALDVA
jgi:hypothetical protein